MNGFSIWVLSIAGICVLSVLVELILPEGQTRKYIKAIFAFFVIIVVISPLPKFIKSDFSFDEILAGDDVELQENFIYQINRTKLDALNQDIEDDLEKQGINGVQIMVSANIFTNKMEIDAVFVDLFELVIQENLQHINTHEIIVETIKRHVAIEEENIIFNE